MKVFITGASGFVGGALVSALKDHHEVYALARSDNSAAKVEALGARPVRGDLAGITPGMLAGIDIVIHSAARAEDWGSREAFYSANVDGTKAVLEAAQAAGAKRFIFIGTEAAFFYGEDMTALDESAPYPASTPFLYSETKAKAEAMVLAANTEGFTTVSIRPRLVWGPGDNSVLPTILEMIAAGQFMWVGGGNFRTDVTHIDNLVHAVLLAFKGDIGGEAFFVTDAEEQNMKEFLSDYIQTQGITPPDKSLPKGLARFLASLVEGIWKLFGLKSRPPMTKFAIYMMTINCTININKAKNKLGYNPVISVKDGIAGMPKLAG